MSTLRFLLWSTLCIGLGLALGTFEIGGRTPWERLQRTWKQQVKNQPQEHYLKEEREALERLISKHTKS